jgi:hypothetical protein
MALICKQHILSPLKVKKKLYLCYSLAEMYVTYVYLNLFEWRGQWSSWKILRGTSGLGDDSSVDGIVTSKRVSFLSLWYLQVKRRSRGSSVSIVSGYGLDDRAIGVRSPAEAKDFSSILCVQTGFGAHPASYTMVTGSPFPGGKARPGRDADHSPPCSAEVENEYELYFLSPEAPPWRVAGLLYFFLLLLAGKDKNIGIIYIYIYIYIYIPHIRCPCLLSGFCSSQFSLRGYLAHCIQLFLLVFMFILSIVWGTF